jgi:hypothetical protein
MTIGGFSDGIPPKSDDKWAKIVNGRTYTFAKVKENNHFLYYCERSFETGTAAGKTSTGFETDRDLTRAEVEQRQQFIEFIAADAQTGKVNPAGTSRQEK